MKFSKITAAGLSAFMITSALGAFPVCAHSITPTDEMKLTEFKAPVWVTNENRDTTQMFETASSSAAVADTENRNSYSVSI